MRTKRRYAHELYPHADEYEVRPLAVEVPYLYAQAIGHETRGTDWLTVWKGKGDKVGAILTAQRTMRMIDARHAALLADAIHQGLTGDEAWEWAASRSCDEEGGWVYDRAKHYGVPVEKIKPYPVLDEPDRHDHYGESDAHGWRTVTRVEGRESECPECCEPDDAEGGEQQ
ncbi:MAG TPA: hypothetical protein PLY19_05895 [Rhodoglobus sp.]|nr:hypothetical protein [Rhodoglobus sp.]